MKSIIWHKGNPPAVGWYNASRFGGSRYVKQSHIHGIVWRWWDGANWSVAVHCNSINPGKRAEDKVWHTDIKWCDYWPSNAVVNRDGTSILKG